MRNGVPLDVFDAECPSRRVIDLIADKWAILTLSAISHGHEHNGELLRKIGGISQKSLTRTLRELEANGLVARLDHNEIPPRVDYTLTRKGQTLIPLLGQMCDWALHNAVLEEATA
jgi:DNA-binding HxlR family transcriptional regulator